MLYGVWPAAGGGGGKATRINLASTAMDPTSFSAAALGEPTEAAPTRNYDADPLLYAGRRDSDADRGGRRATAAAADPQPTIAAEKKTSAQTLSSAEEAALLKGRDASVSSVSEPKGFVPNNQGDWF
jgi:hypothetical protein